MSWTVWFNNGDSEVTPPEVDRMVVRNDFLIAEVSRTYGADDVWATYPIVNVRKWSKNP
jgi:hypothetical protein